MSRRIRLLIQISGSVLLASGLAEIAFTLLAARSPFDSRLARVAFPMTSLCSADFDVSRELVWIGLCKYSRIQAYRPDGSFVRGVGVPGFGGRFVFKLDEAGNLVVRVARGRSEHLFSSEGNLLRGPTAIAPVDSVPNWLEAGKQIEMGASNSLRDSISERIKTCKLDFVSLGESVLGVFADVGSERAVKELLTRFGRG